MSCIYIENNTYFYDKLPEYPLSNLNEHTRHVLTFCCNWLNGQDSFELNTSGSTGKPKKIQLSRQQMQTSAQFTNTFFQLNSQDHFLVCMNTRMIAGVMMLVRALEIKASVTIIEPTGNPLESYRNYKLKSEGKTCNFTAMVPLQIENALSSKNKVALNFLNKMKAVLVGGGPVNATLAGQIQQLACPVYHTYGMTETVSHVALKRLNGECKTNYYQTLPEVLIKQNDAGCLMIKAPMTNNKWITTNDRVEILSTTEFKWLGRADFVINSGGIKIQAEELEKKIAKYFAENKLKIHFFISGVPDKKLGEKVCLFIEGNGIDTILLKSDLKKILSKYEVPKQIFTSNKFHLTDSGKLDRKRIIQDFSH